MRIKFLDGIREVILMKLNKNQKLFLLKKEYVEIFNRELKKLSDFIQEGNQKYAFYRGSLSVSDDSTEDNTIFCITLLASDLDGRFRLLKFDADFDQNSLMYYSNKWIGQFDNEKQILNCIYDLVTDFFEKVPIDFTSFYWDFNQYSKFKEGFMIQDKKGTALILNNDQSNAEYNLLGSAKDSVRATSDYIFENWRIDYN